MFFRKEKKIQELQNDNSKLQNDNSKLQNDNSKLSSTIDQMSLTIDKLNNEILQKEELIQEAEKLVSKKNIIISDLQNENKLLNSKINNDISNVNRNEKQQEMPELLPLIHNQANNLSTLIEFQFHFLEYFGDNPFEKLHNLKEESIKNIFYECINLLEKSLGLLISDINKDYSSRNISEKSWKNLLLMHSNLKKFLITPFDINTPVLLRDISVNLFKIINASNRKIKKSRIRDLLSKTKELERLVCLYNLHGIIQRTQKNNNTLMSKIKSYFNNDDMEKKCDIFNLHSALKEVVNEYQDLAKLRNINILLPSDMNYHLKLPKDCFKKSIGNLLENAIKYTGKLPPDSPYDKTWIDIRTILSSNKIIIDIESWGIPVTKEEYENNLMFKEGYRGRFATHLGISGTGIGLAYVYNFAKEYNGELLLKTVPIDKYSNPSSYTKTTVSLQFPFIS